MSVATLLGASLYLGVAGMLPAAQRGWAGNMSQPTATGPGSLTAAEVRAALWLDANAGRDDVIATNVHCVFVVTRPNCETRAFWVSALSGRPAVVEGWAFVPATLAAHGLAGFSYSQQPPPDWARFALNERVFADPTEEDLRRLREEYGVRWLFADTRAGPVSSTLAAHATMRYADAPVTIYELPGF